MEFDSGDWAEITRYAYEGRVVISAIGTLFPEDHDPYSWGRLGYWESRDMDQYIVTNSQGETVRPGDVVTNTQGESGLFEGVMSGPRADRPARVWVGGQWRYASLFGLTVRDVSHEAMI